MLSFARKEIAWFEKVQIVCRRFGT